MASPILKHFRYDHLPPALQTVSKVFHEVALHFDTKLPDCEEKQEGLRKMLEAKDCMVRAAREPKE